MKNSSPFLKGSEIMSKGTYKDDGPKSRKYFYLDGLDSNKMKAKEETCNTQGRGKKAVMVFSYPVISVRPYVVFSPVIPQSAAGMRTEPVCPETLNLVGMQIIVQIKQTKVTLIPPPSVPRAAEHRPEATIAAEPEEDPPVYLLGSCGFLVVLQCSKPEDRLH